VPPQQPHAPPAVGLLLYTDVKPAAGGALV